MVSIDTLPDNVLVDILSLLPLKDAVRTSVLSRAWRNLWKCIVRVDLSVDRGDRMLTRDFWNAAIRVYNHVVSNILSAKLKALRIEFGYPCRHTHELDCLIDFGMRRGVEELCLNFQNNSPEPCYRLPQFTFCSATLRKLELDKCLVRDLLPASTHLPRLSTLVLCNSKFDDTTFKALISACPVLEDVSVDLCDVTGQLVFNAQNRILKNLRFRCKAAVNRPSNIKILICAPSLELLELGGGIRRGMYAMKNLASLRKANLRFSGPIEPGVTNEILGYLHHVETLNLWCNREKVVSRT